PSRRWTGADRNRAAAGARDRRDPVHTRARAVPRAEGQRLPPARALRAEALGGRISVGARPVEDRRVSAALQRLVDSRSIEAFPASDDEIVGRWAVAVGSFHDSRRVLAVETRISVAYQAG